MFRGYRFICNQRPILRMKSCLLLCLSCAWRWNALLPLISVSFATGCCWWVARNKSIDPPKVSWSAWPASTWANRQLVIKRELAEVVQWQGAWFYKFNKQLYKNSHWKEGQRQLLPSKSPSAMTGFVNTCAWLNEQRMCTHYVLRQLYAVLKCILPIGWRYWNHQARALHNRQFTWNSSTQSLQLL